MKPAPLYFEILKGGPFDGLPALCLRLEDEGEEFDLGAMIQIVSNMSPPPMHFRVLYVAGEVEDASMLRLLQLVSSYGMGTSVEIFGPFFAWMLQFGWRCLHTSDLCIAHPVEEIVFSLLRHDSKTLLSNWTRNNLRGWILRQTTPPRK